jgi:hypothetical protein
VKKHLRVGIKGPGVGRRAVVAGGLASLIVGLAASPAIASKTPPSVDGSPCSAPEFSQPFLSIGDSHWYTLAPGQSAGNFAGDGWTLGDGAQVEPAGIAGDRDGFVLDLPRGAKAVSPPTCVDTRFKAARTMIRSVGANGGGVRVRVSYESRRFTKNPKNTGRLNATKHAWSASRRFNVKPSHRDGWQLATFSFKAEGKDSEFQLYDFYVDPRMK